MWFVSTTCVGCIWLLAAARDLSPVARTNPVLQSCATETALFALVLITALMQLLPLDVAIQRAFAVSTAVGPSVSLVRGDTLVWALVFAAHGLLFHFVAAAVANDTGLAAKGIFILFLTGCAIALLSIINLTQLGDTVWGVEKTSYRGFNTGPFFNRDAYAMYLGMMLSVGCAVVMDGMTHPLLERRLMQVGGGILGALTVLVALILTGSRMGLLAAAAGVVVTVVAVLWSGYVGEQHSRRWPWYLALGGILGAGALGVYGEGLLDRLLTLRAASGDRLELYRQVLAAITLRPLTGYGAGTFSAVFPSMQAVPLSGDVIWDRAHSTYLTAIFELGVPVGTAAIALLVLLFVWVCRFSRYVGLLPLSALGAGVVCGLQSTVDFGFEFQANSFMLVTLLAVAVGMRLGSLLSTHTHRGGIDHQQFRQYSPRSVEIGHGDYLPTRLAPVGVRPRLKKQDRRHGR